METDSGLPRVRGVVKWFDPGKGFGFIVSDEGGPDILLHINALRNYGQGSVSDRAVIVVTVHQSGRGLQVAEVLEIQPSPDEEMGLNETSAGFDPEVLVLPLEPARVKWFDKSKGFGFANVFGRSEDVFVHIEVLRRSGFAELQAGEGIGLRIVDGERGRMAVMIASWDSALKTER